MACSSLVVLFFSCFIGLCCFSYAETDTLKQGQLLHDWEQLISAEGIFKLGFFNLEKNVLIGPSGPRYLGIWYVNIPIYPVWVANSKNPIPDSSGALTMDSDGPLKITYSGGPAIVINSNQAPMSSSGNMTATLLDTGNLVVREVDANGIAGPVLWQSFDYPGNMLLPGMKLGMNLKTGHSWSLTSWLSDKAPIAGAFRLGLDPDSDQLVVWRRGEAYWTSGVWKNGSFQLASQFTKRDDLYEFKFVTNENERYFSYSVTNRSIFSRWSLASLGEIEQFALDRRDSDTWIFETTSPCTLDVNNQSAVCLNEKPTKCRNGSDMFVPRKGYFMPYEFWSCDSNMSLALSDCHTKCWNNCSCIAYQTSSANGTGTGCQFWQRGSEFVPNEIYDAVYLLTPENAEGVPAGETLIEKDPSRSSKDFWWIWLVMATTFALTMLALGSFCHLRRRNHKILQQKGQKKIYFSCYL